MNSIYIRHAGRFFILLLLQTLILNNINLGQISIFIYPLALMLLPLEVPHGILVAVGFFYGLLMDVFTNSLGLHAAILTLLAFARPGVCWLIEPRGGYELGQTLSRASQGTAWFFKYSAIMMGGHIFFLTLLENLSLGLAWLLQMVLSYIFSMLLLIIYQYIFNPK